MDGSGRVILRNRRFLRICPCIARTGQTHHRRRLPLPANTTPPAMRGTYTVAQPVTCRGTCRADSPMLEPLDATPCRSRHTPVARPAPAPIVSPSNPRATASQPSPATPFPSASATPMKKPPLALIRLSWSYIWEATMNNKRTFERANCAHTYTIRVSSYNN